VIGRIDVRDAARRIAELGDGIENDPVVVSVGGRTDEDSAAQARDLLHVAVVLDRRRRWRVPALIGIRKKMRRARHGGMGGAGAPWERSARRSRIWSWRPSDRPFRTLHWAPPASLVPAA